MTSAIRILVCDDSRLLRRLLARMIEPDPALWLVREVGTGEECLALLPEVRPDVVIMDIALPRMSGLDCLRAARHRGSDAEFLILSAHAQPDAPQTQDALAAGAFGCIPKADGLLAMDQVQARVLEAVHAAGARALARPGRPDWGPRPASPAAAPRVAAPAPPSTGATSGASARGTDTAPARPAAPAQLPCTNCEKPVDAADLLACPLCTRAHHRTCFEFNRGCSYPGCRGGKLKGALQAVYVEEERSALTRRKLLRAGAAIAALALGGAAVVAYRAYLTVQRLKRVVRGTEASVAPSPRPSQK